MDVFHPIFQQAESLIPKVLRYFFPFRGVINLGENLIGEFIDILSTNLPELDLQTQSVIDTILSLSAHGLVEIHKQFPTTQLVVLHPALPAQLARLAAYQLTPSQKRCIESCFIEYYDWYSEGLRQMYLYSSAEERPENITFYNLELENMYQAQQLAIANRKFGQIALFLSLNTLLDLNGNHEKRQTLSEQLVAAVEQIPECDWNQAHRLSLVDAWDNLGSIYIEFGDFEKAQKQVEKALDRYKQFKLDDEIPGAMIGFYQKLGGIAYYEENFEKGYQYFLKTLELAEQYAEEEQIGDYNLNAGLCLMAMNSYEEADKHFIKAIQIFESLGLQHWVARVYHNLAKSSLAAKNLEKFESYFEKILEMYETLGDNSRKGDVLNEYSILYLGRHEYDKAQSLAERALSIFIEENEKEKQAKAYINLAGALIGKEEFDIVAEYLETSVKIAGGEKNNQLIGLALRTATLVKEHPLGKDIWEKVVTILLKYWPDFDLKNL